MKKSAKNSALIVLGMLSCVTIASARHAFVPAPQHAPLACVATVDDPPPEPLTCPLCGGDPALHARRMIALESLQAGLLANILHW